MFRKPKPKQPIVVRTYERTKDYEKDANKMLAQGYRVAMVTTQQAKPATAWLGGVGLLAPTKLIVTYQLVGS